jgi:hypothetical protein
MRQLVTICLIAAVLAAPVRHGLAADPAGTLQKALGSAQPLYKCTESELIAATKVCAASDPRNVGDCIAMILESGRRDSGMIAPALVQAGIEGLGPNPSADLIAGIIRAAVKTAPEQVLDIVRVAVKASPRSAAPAIVSAAVESVPHPDQMVTMDYGRVETTSYTNDKQIDFKDYKDIVPAEKQLTLADAIVQAAMEADPSLSQDALTVSVNGGIGGTPVLAPGIPVPLPPPPGTGGGFNAPGPVSP